MNEAFRPPKWLGILDSVVAQCEGGTQLWTSGGREQCGSDSDRESIVVLLLCPLEKEVRRHHMV